MFSRIVGDGIELRPLEERHAPELFALVDRNRDHIAEWLPWLHAEYAIEDTLAFIRMALDQFARNRGFHAGVWVDGRITGAIGLHDVDWKNRSTSLGYWLDAAVTGRGVMTRCCRAIIGHLFAELDLNRIEIRCAAGNAKSCAIPERLGFRREGVLREAQWVGGRPLDLQVYGLLRREWVG